MSGAATLASGKMLGLLIGVVRVVGGSGDDFYGLPRIKQLLLLYCCHYYVVAWSLLLLLLLLLSLLLSL